MKLTPEFIYSLNPNEVFVFGSNLSGFHAAGAARTAMKWGAVWGKGIGHHGKTYAIPTKSKGIKRSLTVLEIKPYVDQFIEYAKTNPDLSFLVTEIGCGLAGYKPYQIAPLFKASLNVDNIYLPLRFIEELGELVLST